MSENIVEINFNQLDMSPGDELMWTGHFSDRYTCNVLLRLGARTFGDMVDLTREQLEATFLGRDSIENAIRVLGERGLQLAGRMTIDDVECKIIEVA